MKRQVVLSGPVNGQLVTGYRDEGPSAAVSHRAQHGIYGERGARIPGTKQPGASGYRKEGREE